VYFSQTTTFTLGKAEAHLTRLHSKGRLQDLHPNIRLGWK
jgi:hypothetical protein